jgi:pantoate--beta-alanine ligase
MSSRNVRLSAEERAAAPILRRALLAGRARYEEGVRDGAALRDAMNDVLATSPLAQPDYVSCADPETLLELEAFDGPALLSMAVGFGAVRLIDNEPLP